MIKWLNFIDTLSYLPYTAVGKHYDTKEFWNIAPIIKEHRFLLHLSPSSFTLHSMNSVLISMIFLNIFLNFIFLPISYLQNYTVLLNCTSFLTCYIPVSYHTDLVCFLPFINFQRLSNALVKGHCGDRKRFFIPWPLPTFLASLPLPWHYFCPLMSVCIVFALGFTVLALCLCATIVKASPASSST